VLAIERVDTDSGHVRPEAHPRIDAASLHGREPQQQEITRIDKEKTKKRSKELDNYGHIEGLSNFLNKEYLMERQTRL
jgi:hypothetical protein